MTTSNEKAIISAQVSVEDRARLMHLAATGDRSLSAELRRAVQAHIEAHLTTERIITNSINTFA